MPIQPLHINSYSQIPDEEDVTPVDGFTKAYRPVKYALQALLVGGLLMGLFVMNIRLNVEATRQVQVIQTSSSQHGGLHEMSPADMHALGATITGIHFGNTHCSNDKHKCDGLQPYPARMFVNTSTRFQEILGFGGAFTEASAINFFKLPPESQSEFIERYFGPSGIQFTMGRIHINSCDFSPASYSFDDVKDDFDLLYFDDQVTHDEVAILPLLRLALQASSGGIRLVASPWSPPAWMKTPNAAGVQSMNGSAVPAGLLDNPRVKRAWALYISRFVSAYENLGVPVWAVTPQNEPEFAAPWEACAYNATSELEFIESFLGPALAALPKKVQLLAFDHNKDHLADWTRTIVGGDALKYVDGMAFHWYGGYDRVTDGTYGYEAINASHHFAPDKILLATEGCSCPGVSVDSWWRAERLAHDVMYDLNNFAQGWIDWNLLVDHTGGPNHLNNMCDASMVALPDFSGFHLQPKYFYFGHISKYVGPGSVRVYSDIVGDFQYAAVNPRIDALVELGLYACEKSSRQMWAQSSSNFSLALTVPSVNVDEVNAAPQRLCVGSGNVNRPYLRVIDCDVEDEAAGRHKGVVELLQMSTHQWMDAATGDCLTVAGDVREAGALLQLSTCVPPVDALEKRLPQMFDLHPTTGAWTSAVKGLCITAGWPFLSSVAFKDKQQMKTTVVLMNEAEVTVSIVLNDASKESTLGWAMAARSMQTIQY